ncbi:hypothetical protein PORY_001469 [Pneumocystis oryctolagi]|uniref:Uncharacterized protein n=1 Tax=Pneumocystis oryctolagi TaxID=42067 RepID=A0ACB7CI91_9ASCO|nr:hypothetical protein PORY_001469 [Pneumocystis oryctolagi]
MSHQNLVAVEEENQERTPANLPCNPSSPEDLSNKNKDDKLAGFLSSVTNLLNTIIGSGVLAMPYAMSLMGVTLGVFVIILSGITSALGLYFLGCSAAKLERGKASFSSVSMITYPSAAILFDLTIGVQCFGVCVSYLILMGDIMPQILKTFNSSISDTSYLVNPRFWNTIFIFILSPFAFFRRLDSFRYISFFAMVSISYMALIIIVYFFRENVWTTGTKVHLFKVKGVSHFFSAISIYAFTFACHQNMFPIVNEIRDNSRKNILSVVVVSVGISFVIYLLVSLIGYLSFGVNVPGNIVLAYKYSIPVLIARIGIVILIAFSYPLQFYPARTSFDKILWRPKFFATENKSKFYGSLRFNLLSFFMLLFSYILAMVIGSFEIVLAYIGSISSVTCFIIPGLFYNKLAYCPDVLYKKDPQDNEQGSDDSQLIEKKKFTKTWYLQKTAVFLCIYGIFILIACLISNIIDTIKK